MIAYLGKPEVKEMYMLRVQEHRRLDDLQQRFGYYNFDEKRQRHSMCAVGCTIHSGKHADYETLLGIPRTLAKLEDCIFEGLPVNDARQWPERFLSSITVGADLSLVWYRFAAWLFTDRNRAAIDSVAALYRRAIGGDMPTRAEWHKAADAAAAARRKALKKMADKLIVLLAEAAT